MPCASSPSFILRADPKCRSTLSPPQISRKGTDSVCYRSLPPAHYTAHAHTGKKVSLLPPNRRPSTRVSPAAWPLDDPDVLESLQRAYRSGDWGRYHGANCEELQTRLANFHGVQFVRLTSSGTVAVELGLAAIGVQPGDEVILAGYDFGGNFRGIEHLQAHPVVVDIDNDLCLHVERLQEAVTAETRAVIVSHLHGSLANMKAIQTWAQQANVAVLEDACQSPGATIEDQLAGTWGDVGVHSFGGSKLLTAGRGGAVITDDPVAYQRMKIYAARGNDAYPMSELQAAVLIPQLEKLQQRNRIRQNAAMQLAKRLENFGALRLIGLASLPHASCYKLAIELSPDLLRRRTRESWIAEAQSRGVVIDAGFRSFARRSQRRCRKVGELPQSIVAGDAVVVLHHPILLTNSDNVNCLADVLREISE